MMDLERFEQLVDSELDGVLSPEGRAELERACALNPDLRRLRHKDLLLSDMMGSIGQKAAPAQLSGDVMRRLLLEKAVVSEERRTTAPAPPAPITPLEPPVRESWWRSLFIGNEIRWGLGLATSSVLVLLGYLALSVNDFNRERVTRNQEARQLAKSEPDAEKARPKPENVIAAPAPERAAPSDAAKPLENVSIASAAPGHAAPAPAESATSMQAAAAETKIEAAVPSPTAAPAPAEPTPAKPAPDVKPVETAVAVATIAKSSEPPAAAPKPEAVAPAPPQAPVEIALTDTAPSEIAQAANAEVGPLKKSASVKQMVRKSAEIIEARPAAAPPTAVADAGPAAGATADSAATAAETTPSGPAMEIEIQLAAAPAPAKAEAAGGAAPAVEGARAFNGAAARKPGAGNRERDLEILFVETGGQILDRDRDPNDAKITHVRGAIKLSRLLEFLKEIERRGIAPRANSQASALPDPGARGPASGESFYTFRLGDRPGDIEPSADETPAEVRFVIREER